MDGGRSGSRGKKATVVANWSAAEATMTKQTYRISFFKNLTDSTGHPVDACQGVIEVRAPTRDRAIELAKSAFARFKDVLIWSLRADYQTVERLPHRAGLPTCYAEAADGDVLAIGNGRGIGSLPDVVVPCRWGFRVGFGSRCRGADNGDVACGVWSNRSASTNNWLRDSSIV
jgi:hypothetical protein